VGEAFGSDCSFQIGDNGQLSIGAGDVKLNLADNVTVTISTGSGVTINNLQQAGTANILVTGQLSLPINTTLNAVVYVNETGKVLVGGYVQFIPSPAGPCISGPGSLYVQGSLQCTGQAISVGFVELGSSSTVSCGTLTPNYLQTNTSTVNGDLSVVGGIQFYEESSLTVNGHFKQVNGAFNISIPSKHEISVPVLRVTESITIQDVHAFVFNAPTPITNSKILIATASSVNASFHDIKLVDASSYKTSIEVDNGSIYLNYDTTDSWLYEILHTWLFYPIIGGVALVLVLIIVLGLCIAKKVKAKNPYHALY